MKNLDVFENKKIIEILKSSILKNISDLYINMAHSLKGRNSVNEDIFSETIINIYILSMRLDLDIERIEKKAIDKMRLKILEKNDSLNINYTQLCSHFRKR